MRDTSFSKKVATKMDNERLIKRLNALTQIPFHQAENPSNKNFLPIFVNSMWLNATDRFCIKWHPEDCGWFMNDYLKLIGFVGDSTSQQVDDVLRATNGVDNYNDDNFSESHYNVDTSDESDTE